MRAVVLLGLVIWPSAAIAAQPFVFVPFLEQRRWQLETDAPYEGWTDRRDLYVLYHPWEESRSGSQATVRSTIEIPHDWEGKVRLRFYMTDDYDTHYRRLEPDNWLGQMNLVGHRFKQVLVDEEVVWERDVADPEGVGQESYYSVLLPEQIGPGDRVRLAFRLIDKVSSRDRLESDYRHIGETESIVDTDPWRFMTHLYIGDVSLAPKSAKAVASAEPPSAERVRARHERYWPLTSLSPPVKFPVSLHWEGAEKVEGMSCPIRCGLALPKGVVRDREQIQVRDGNKQRLPVQLRPMNRWPDGSLRWVELDTTAHAGQPTRTLFLDLHDGSSQEVLPELPVRASTGPSGQRVLETGELKITLSSAAAPLSCRIEHGSAVLDQFTGIIEIEREQFVPTVEVTRVLAEGPLRAEIECAGVIRTPTSEMGRFVFRIAAFAGQPYVRITWRTFNDQCETLEISRFELVGQFVAEPRAALHWGNPTKAGYGSVQVRQLRDNHFEVMDGAGDEIDHGQSSEGWLGVQGETQSMAVLVRHFSEQFPKALEWKEGRLRIALFESSEDRPYYRPTEGEAKRHELWLGLWNESISPDVMRRFAQFAARPARLFSATYFCQTGALGPASHHSTDRFEEIEQYIKETYPGVAARQFYDGGIRHWGDRVYNQEQNTWCNGYYDRQQGFMAEYLMSGDSRWFDRLEATVRHLIDIDVCHASEEHPEWVGAIHGPSASNHTGGPPWNPTQRTKGTLAYWRLTGDLDARDAALAVADSALREERGMGATSVRDHAGILYCLTAAYDETQDEKYLVGARRIAHDAIGRIDRRRGCYSEIHGNVSYRGNVPWMCAQLAEPLFDYYRQSGDIEAAVAVVGLAESILEENRDRHVEGDVYGYPTIPITRRQATITS